MKKLRFIAVALAAALLAGMGAFALAEEEIQVKTTASVNLRRGPSKDYSIITSVNSGRWFDYTGISSYDSRGIVWHRVEYKSGYAWISSVYSNVVNDGVELNDATYVETTAAVNLRTGPGTGYKKLAAAVKNAQLFYLGEQAKDASGRVWYKVASSAGEAWLTSRYSRIRTSETNAETEAYVMTTSSVNMRKGPGLGYGKIVAFSKGKKLTYLNESSVDYRGVTWYKVKSGDYAGWMSSMYSDLYK